MIKWEIAEKWHNEKDHEQTTGNPIWNMGKIIDRKNGEISLKGNVRKKKQRMTPEI